MADVWNPRDEEHRRAFLAIVAPLVAASRPREFGTVQVAHDQARAFLMTLRDVPRDVLEAGVESLMSKGVTWMPKPGELKAACAEVVGRRRSEARRRAQEMRASCEQCDSTGWETVKDDEGHERAKPCWCVTRGNELIAQAGQPIALPPAREIEGDVA